MIKFTTFILLTAVIYKFSHLIVPQVSQFAAWLLLLVVAWKSAHFISRQVLANTALSSATNRAVLITGCDTGFGHHTALELNALGYHVFAGCLNANSDHSKMLTSACKSAERMQLLQLDVTSETDIKLAKQIVEDTLAASGLELYSLVNNAGRGGMNVVEWHDGPNVRDLKDMLDVNLHGAVRMCRAFLPLIRACRGRVVNVTSYVGLHVLPYNSVYGASKMALQAFSDALRYELSPFGVQVVSIAPWGFPTAINNCARLQDGIQRQWCKASEEVRKSYGESNLQYMCRFVHGPSVQGWIETDVRLVVDAIVEAIRSQDPDPTITVMQLWRKIGLYLIFDCLPNEMRIALMQLCCKLCIVFTPNVNLVAN